MKYFYSHLIEIESLIVELDELKLADSEKKSLALLADETLHTAILDAVLSKLPEDQRRQLMEHIGLEKHDEVWQILNEHIDEVEKLVKETANEVKENLRKDVKEAKKIKVSQ